MKALLTVCTVLALATLMLSWPGSEQDHHAMASTVLTPIADSYVDAAKPTRNFGNAKHLKTGASPVMTSYLKFKVQGLGPITSAALRIFAKSNNPSLIQVRGVVNDTWTEGGITYANVPAAGDVVNVAGPITAGQWFVLDVSAFAAVDSDGTLSLALTTASTETINFSSRNSNRPPQLLVPAPTGASKFIVSRSGDSYTAYSQTTGTVYTGTVKSVVESAMTELNANGGGTVAFTGGTFDLGADRFQIYFVDNIVFEGQGIDVTIIQNSNDAAADTEPFDLRDSDGITIRDLTVIAGGATRTTSDAIDFDGGDNSVVERVKVADSRGRGIVFDGKDVLNSIPATADGNVVRDCIITGVQGDGIELLASSNNLIEGCVISDVGGHGIQINKASAVADQPNKKSNNNSVVGNTISGASGAGSDGIDLISGDNNLLVGNTISASGRDGIRVTSSADSIACDGNTVDGNTATTSARYGLNIASALCNNTVVCSNNNFAGNRLGEIQDLGTNTQFVSCGSVATIAGAEAVRFARARPFLAFAGTG